MAEKPMTEKQIGVAISLFRGSSVREAAREFGVSEATIYDWKKTRDFMDLWRNLENEMKSREVERLQSLREKAFSRIEKILEDPDSSDRNALQAASIALNASDGIAALRKDRNLSPVTATDVALTALEDL